MANKSELIERLQKLVEEEDVEQAAEAVEAVKEAFEALVAADHDHAPAEAEAALVEEAAQATPAVNGSEGQLHIESAPLHDEEDKRFKQLLDAFNTRVNDIRRQKAREEAANLAAKREIMDELRSLIAGEENIGNAFKRFSELQEKWKSIGPVPQQAYRELQSDYSHLRDDFYYHIRIYQELRDHDLRKNTGLKQALISDMQALAEKDGVKELETLVKEYQEKWHQIGPVLREEWEIVRDGFWNATRAVYDKIHEHYKARRAEHEANLAAKQSLVDKVIAIGTAAREEGQKDWKALTEQVLELQNAWKQVGFATKKENERVWKEFRAACNAYFDAKKDHFNAMKEKFREAREMKMALVEEAQALKDSTEWRQAADKFKALQQRWKEAGSAGPRDENKLWNRFREACDHFFKARKAVYAQLDAEQAENVKGKEALLAELEGFQLTGDRNADIETLKTFSQRWMSSGRVSPKLYDSFSERYRAALDKHYGALRMEGEARVRQRSRDHIESLKAAPDGRDRIERESRFVKRKIEELENEMRQMDRNMGMFNFKTASGEAMKKDMEKKIEKLARDVDRLKEQHRELLKELR
ncbi:MAG: DUF349 domain-containing protein [Flavobacteriales bacterium]|nr:DUF349 domain-containing protein [Flavobacteriales bacterium]